MEYIVKKERSSGHPLYLMLIKEGDTLKLTTTLAAHQATNFLSASAAKVARDFYQNSLEGEWKVYSQELSIKEVV